MKNLRDTFEKLVENYFHSDKTAELWNEIELHYSFKERFYHNLTHLENLLFQLEQIKELIEDWETVLFCLFYHDIVYDASKSDNEKQSAELAKKRLEEIGFPKERIERCINHILATKSHHFSEDNDTNLFTDADLSILGAKEEIYMKYAQNVRKEYSIYPDELYFPGRTKVLEHFLAMKRIFKTEHFFLKFEARAKRNILKEMKSYE